MQNTIGQPPQPQSVQVPNYSGVNIQIFNPTVAAPGAAPPVLNTNNNSNYYTNPIPANYYHPDLIAPKTQTTGTVNGSGTDATATANATATINQPSAQVPQTAQTPPTQEADKKKTEKREIVQLTDEYIKNLENYLNSQDPEVRVMGAKAVVDRLQEDNSRKDDKALNALVNKMVQDPSQKVKIMAMACLNSRIATGDNTTVQLLKGIQQQTTGYGQDAKDATNILLKMAGTTVEKEFEVKDKPKKETKSEKA